jgi:alpha-mannosidase
MKYNVHLICNAHLDPVWQWRWTEGCSEALMTFRNAAEILDEYPELIFNHNEAILYQWVQQYDPQLFIRIQELVSRGRWFISGGWFLQPDVNLPPVENLYRNIRTGREFFKRYFGSEPKVAYNFDSFGHPGTLPDILSEFGYEMYIHQRPEKEFLTLPGSLYRWKGPKGGNIAGYRIEIGLYHNERTNIQQRLREGADLALQLGRDVAVFWGIGDHGGGASRADMDKIREYISLDSRVNFIHSTTDRFLQAVKPLIPQLPEFEGSLQRIFTGCYTSLSRIKRKALEASGAAVQMEKLGEKGKRRIGEEEIWRDILFNDFHDILPGSCTEPAEQDALDLYGRAMENIRRANMDSISRINRTSPELKAYIPVTVFNSNEHLSTFPVEFECMSDYRPLWTGEWELKLYDRNGSLIASQEEQPEALLPFHRWRRKISFLAENLKPGVHHFSMKAVPAVAKHTFDTDSLQSPDLQPEYMVMEDLADSWGTNTFAWRNLLGTFEKVGGSERIIEQGPVRTGEEEKRGWGASKIVIHKYIYPNWPVTEYRIRVHWNEERKRLKIAIPVKMSDPLLTAQIPGGAETFPPDSQEYVHGTWISLKEPGSGKQMFIAHNGCHGFDYDGNEVRLSVLRSAAYCHEQGFSLENGPYRKFMDQGVHEIRMAVWEDAEIDPAGIAEWLITPPLVWPHLPIG